MFTLSSVKHIAIVDTRLKIVTPCTQFLIECMTNVEHVIHVGGTRDVPAIDVLIECRFCTCSKVR